MNNPDISVIIVNYKTEHELLSCLSSLSKYKPALELETIVVNNSEYNYYFEKIKTQYPDVTYISNNNSGFSRAINLGVDISLGTQLIFINPDTLFIEDCITPIFNFIKKYQHAGVCGPMLLNNDMTYQNSTGFRMGIFYEIAEAFFFISLFRIVQKIRYIKKQKVHQNSETSWLSGAFIVVRRSVFEEVGGFDPDYFLNYEDIDFCLKVKEHGYRNYYFPYLKCLHTGLASQAKDYEKLVFSRYQSRLIYAKKHYNYLIRLLVRTIHILGLLLRLCVIFFTFRSLENTQRMKGYRKTLKLYFKYSIN
ncbi:MAG: glycosyltransferase family 2 protein [Ignavibacteria bacterium]|jgi:GT2 family glycosyltransferase